MGLASELGLQKSIPLAKRCAEFYLLEHLNTNARRWVRNDGFGRPMYERNAPMDSRLEMRQVQAEHAFATLVDELFEEFSLYLLYAAGGELMFVRNPDGGDPSLKNWECPNHVEAQYSECGSYIACMCECSCDDYNERMAENNEEWEPENDPDCVPCNYVCEWRECDGCCQCSGDASYDETTGEYYCFCGIDEPSNKGPKAWDAETAWVLNEIKDKGAAAFIQYATVAGYEKAARMADTVFTHGSWKSGYGGERWALPLRIMADAHAGKMQRVTFVDRLWSIQHNGGSIFDKAYNVGSHYDHSCPSLMKVLEEQAKNNYKFLSWHAPSGYFWRDSVRLMRNLGMEA